SINQAIVPRPSAKSRIYRQIVRTGCCVRVRTGTAKPRAAPDLVLERRFGLRVGKHSGPDRRCPICSPSCSLLRTLPSMEVEHWFHVSYLDASAAVKLVVPESGFQNLLNYFQPPSGPRGGFLITTLC